MFNNKNYEKFNNTISTIFYFKPGTHFETRFNVIHNDFSGPFWLKKVKVTYNLKLAVPEKTIVNEVPYNEFEKMFFDQSYITIGNVSTYYLDFVKNNNSDKNISDTGAFIILPKAKVKIKLNLSKDFKTENFNEKTTPILPKYMSFERGYWLSFHFSGFLYLEL